MEGRAKTKRHQIDGKRQQNGRQQIAISNRRRSPEPLDRQVPHVTFVSVFCGPHLPQIPSILFSGLTRRGLGKQNGREFK